MRTSKRCCPDHANICSRSRQLFLDAVERAGKREADFGLKPRRCWRDLFAESEARPILASPSDTVPLRSRRSRQPFKSKGRCGCDIILSVDDANPSWHSDVCMRTLCWVVRVPYETQAGRLAHADSTRMCRVDAVRLAAEYGQHKAKVIRVFPLHT